MSEKTVELLYLEVEMFILEILPELIRDEDTELVKLLTKLLEIVKKK